MLIDLVRWVLKFLPHILLGAPIIYWAYRELRDERGWRWAMWPVLIVGFLASAIFLATGFAQTTRYVWSAARLAPAMAWLKGYSLYYPIGEGPILVQMYGPVSALAYTPAALAATPTWQMLIAACINIIFYFAPGIWFLGAARQGAGIRFLIAGIALFILLSSRVLALNVTATHVTIDAPAIGLAACAFAVMAQTKAQLPWRTGLICGALVALAAWTKWTVAPSVLAMCVYALLVLPLRSAMKFIAAMAIVGAIISVLFILWLGPEVLVQTIAVAGRQPWQIRSTTPQVAYFRKVQEILLRDSFPVGLVLLAAISWRIRPREITAQGLRAWAMNNPWLLPLFGAVFVLPTSALAYVKVGGIFNNASSTTYFAILAAACALVGVCTPIEATRSAGEKETGSLFIASKFRLGRILLCALLVANCVIDQRDLERIRREVPLLKDMWDNDHERVFQYARLHPGEVYFPSYPLSVLSAEGKLYHFAAGIDDLEWGGFPVSNEHFRSWLPPNLRAVVIRENSFGSQQFIDARFPEFVVSVRIPSMPGWIAFTRDGALP